MYLPPLSPSTMRVLSVAASESATADHHFLGVEHLFLGLIAEKESGVAQALAGQNVEPGRVHALLMKEEPASAHRLWGDELIYSPRCHEVLHLAGKIASQVRDSTVEPSHILEAIFREGRSIPLRVLRELGVDLVDLQSRLTPESAPEDTPTPVLDRLGRDLTALAATGALSPVIGRVAEMNLLEQVLLRKNKNNPVLVGDAGVGKTAVVEGFAQRLVGQNCPEPFKGNRVVELSLVGLIAGTKFRGEFEERVLALLEEARAHPEIILFLDEIHTVVGAGSSGADSLDAGDILKPALARGEIRVVGATTISEYRKTIEKDSALDRRFDKVTIEEPSRDDTIAILRGVREGLEAHHEVPIHEDALVAAVDLTVKHLPDRRLPDKAMDALDQSCARHRLQAFRRPSSPDRSAESAQSLGVGVTVRDITKTVSQWTGIPLESLGGDQAEAMLNLEDDLRQRVIGQDHAVAAVSRAIRTARAGLAAPHRPTGVFLFMGPTGVGKTELAKSLAALMFGDEKRLIRFDMSEYTEPHAVAKLIGAPPGYVGYDEEGLLIAAVRTHPHSVVLFDEIEKAHPRLFDLFLQIFDEGRLSGSHGHAADFTHAVVIMTSNLDPQPAPAPKKVGFPTPAGSPEEKADWDLRKALIGPFRAELVNRIDEIVQFNRLGAGSLRDIIDIYVREIQKQLEEKGASLTLDDAVYDHIIQQSESETFGARELRRIVDHALRQPLAEELLRAGGNGGRIKVALSGSDTLEFRTT